MYFTIDANQIFRLSSNGDVYKLGKQFYKDGYVLDKNIREENDKQVIDAKVLCEDKKTYRVGLYFLANGSFYAHACNCPAHSMWKGACKHVVAALFSVHEDNKHLVEEAQNKRLAKSMIDLFEKRVYKEIDTFVSQNTVSENLVSLIPTLVLKHKDKPYIVLTIGRNKQYIIKNILTFLDNMERETAVSYGKNFEFTHKKHLLDDYSKKLYDLIKEEGDYSKNNSRTSYNSELYYSNDAKKGLVLSKRGIDDLIALHKDKSLSVQQIVGEAEEYLILDETQEIKYNLEIVNNNINIKFNGVKYNGFVGEKNYYICDDEKLLISLCSEEYYNTLKLIEETFVRSVYKDIVIPQEDKFRFINYVYPILAKNNLVDSGFDFQDEEIIFSTIEKKIYFDTEGKEVSCTVLFCYGDFEFNPLINKADEQSAKETNKTIFSQKVIRNKLEEYKTISHLESCGFVGNETKKQYILKEESAIYDFYYAENGLNLIKNNTEVYLSDSFKTKSFRKSANTSFGVRLVGNLLEIDIDSNNYKISELQQILESFNLKKKYHRLKDGSFLTFENNDNNLAETAAIMSGLSFSEKDIKNGKLLVPKYRSLYLSNLAKVYKNVQIEQNDELDKLESDFISYKDLNYNIPKSLEKIMRTYQKDGFNWLNVIAYYGFGAILADDMGLGKTLQFISVLLAEKEKNIENNIVNQKTSIVIAPTSLVYNWEKEINKFAPSITSLAVMGNASKRVDLLDNANKYDVLLTTYDTLKRDIDLYKDIDFKFIVADEAQNIKNPMTQNAQAVKSLKGETRFALTGTPIENSLSELWSIFDFIMPGYLFSHAKFSKNFEIPIIKENNENVSAQLIKQISPFILRRIKKDVLKELPDKIESTLYADMTDEQEKLYTAYHMQTKGELEENIIKGDFNKKKIDLLAQITRLRQICCHPAVFVDGYKGGSGKLDLTIETIETSIETGHRILIFSQFTSMLGIISDELNKRNISYFYLDGATSSMNRLKMSEDFNSGINSVFLISLKAGGTGLNLTGADVVIHFDPWWNPAVMDQASDRAHRFGQDKVVQVFNIVAKNTIEEKILLLQNKKRYLTENVIKEGAVFINKMEQDDVLELFKD